MYGEIMLPNGKTMKRIYDDAVVMEKVFRERYLELMAQDTRAGVVFTYIVENTNENGEFVASKKAIGEAVGYSQTTVSRVLKVLKDKYQDIIKIQKTSGEGQTVVNKYVIDTDRCFKSFAGDESV